MMNLKTPLICLATLLVASPLLARETIVNGSVGVGYDYWERTYDGEGNNGDTGDKRDYGISPEISITSKGVKDTVFFRYAPVFKYDDIDYETDVDHYLALSGQRFITRNWSVSIADNLRNSDDPYFSAERFSESTLEEETEPTLTDEQASTSLTGDELSKDEGRSRYWTNALSVSTSYIFSEYGSLGGGYTYSILRNDDDFDPYDEYDKHSFYANLGYRYSQSWDTGLGLNYTRGLYDEDDPDQRDLDQYGVTASVDYIHSATDSVPFVYGFSATKYDQEERQDSYAHNFSLGWEHAIDSRTRFAVGGGPSYADADRVEGEWDYNVYFNFTRDYEHASLSLLFDKIYDTQNFTGTNDSGLKDTYNARVTFDYQHTQNLSFDLYCGYRLESNYTPRDEYLLGSSEGDSIGDVTYDKDIYDISAGLSYNFLRYYTAGLRYTYYVSDGDLNSDQYTDHRVMITLSAGKDLWRW